MAHFYVAQYDCTVLDKSFCSSILVVRLLALCCFIFTSYYLSFGGQVLIYLLVVRVAMCALL